MSERQRYGLFILLLGLTFSIMVMEQKSAVGLLFYMFIIAAPGAFLFIYENKKKGRK